MSIIKQLKYETIHNLATTELNALAAAARAIGPAQGADATDANLLGDAILSVTFAVAPVVDTLVDLYLVRAADGTNYEDGSATVVPTPDSFVGSWPMRAVTTAQIRVIRDIPIPAGLYKAIVQNNTAQAFPATGTTVTLREHNRQVI
jgi:hypothetical protein